MGVTLQEVKDFITEAGFKIKYFKDNEKELNFGWKLTDTVGISILMYTLINGKHFKSNCYVHDMKLQKYMEVPDSNMKKITDLVYEWNEKNILGTWYITKENYIRHVIEIPLLDAKMTKNQLIHIFTYYNSQNIKDFINDVENVINNEDTQTVTTEESSANENEQEKYLKQILDNQERHLLRKIVDYTVLRESPNHDLDEVVKKLINDGWVPHGGMSISPGGYYMQAMVKYDR